MRVNQRSEEAQGAARSKRLDPPPPKILPVVRCCRISQRIGPITHWSHILNCCRQPCWTNCALMRLQLDSISAKKPEATWSPFCMALISSGNFARVLPSPPLALVESDPSLLLCHGTNLPLDYYSDPRRQLATAPNSEAYRGRRAYDPDLQVILQDDEEHGDSAGAPP